MKCHPFKDVWPSDEEVLELAARLGREAARKGKQGKTNQFHEVMKMVKGK
jgi:hypothetical protein